MIKYDNEYCLISANTNIETFTTVVFIAIVIIIKEMIWLAEHLDEWMEKHSSGNDDGEQEEPEEKSVKYLGDPRPVLRVVHLLFGPLRGPCTAPWSLMGGGGRGGGPPRCLSPPSGSVLGGSVIHLTRGVFTRSLHTTSVSNPSISVSVLNETYKITANMLLFLKSSFIKLMSLTISL